jgi:hypothetical protein
MGMISSGAQGNGGHRLRARATTTTIATVGAVLAIGAGASGAVSRRACEAEARAHTAGARAHAAGVLDGKATACLTLIEVEGSELEEEGPVVGVLTGSARGKLHLGAVFKASFTITTRNGSITGEGTAIPGVAHTYQSFEGSFTVTRGSGRYAHIHGRPQHLKGVLDRHSDSVVIETTGQLNY